MEMKWLRKIFPNTTVKDLVGVQPMTSPSGTVFYIKPSYTSMKVDCPKCGSLYTPRENNEIDMCLGCEKGEMIDEILK
jgi:hypothetical protein